MNIILSGKQMNVSQKQREIIEEKLARLDKYFNNDVIVRATVSERKSMQKVEVTINVSKSVIRAEASDYDLYCAVDDVVSKLARQLRKYKTKLKNRGTATIRFENIEEPAYTDEVDEKITKRKKFSLSPMSEEEACLQMEMLGHDFFVFMNSATDSVSVLYKRKDGHYGIIEQE